MKVRAHLTAEARASQNQPLKTLTEHRELTLASREFLVLQPTLLTGSSKVAVLFCTGALWRPKSMYLPLPTFHLTCPC